MVSVYLSLLSLSLQALPVQAKEDLPVVAIVDTGTDIQHPLLRDYLWENSGETGVDSHGRDRRTNGIDDDRNGYVDDVHGWNFASNNNSLRDNHGHGTHIAGILTQTKKVKIMILKYYDTFSAITNTVRATSRAFEYAVKNGAAIINYSAGGYAPDPMELRTLQQAARGRVLVVAAAGNNSSNNDVQPYYPASYKLNNVIAVAAHNPQGRLLASSNFGAESVDLAALGENVLSTLPHGHFGTMTGTSQATAMVSRSAAEFIALRKGLKDPQRVIHYLIGTGVWDLQYASRTQGRVRLDSSRLLSMLDGDTSIFGYPLNE